MAALTLLRRMVAFELGIWRSLYRWTFRRPVALGPDGQAFGYAAEKTPIIWAFIGVSAIEIPAVHLLLPWPAIRFAALVAGAQALLWMLGVLASMRVHPHVINDTGLRISSGATIGIVIGWDAIASISHRARSTDSGRTVQFAQTRSGTALDIVVLSKTNVEVLMRQPIAVNLPQGASQPIAVLRCYADDPAAFVAQARGRLSPQLPPVPTHDR